VAEVVQPEQGYGGASGTKRDSKMTKEGLEYITQLKLKWLHDLMQSTKQAHDCDI